MEKLSSLNKLLKVAKKTDFYRYLINEIPSCDNSTEILETLGFYTTKSDYNLHLKQRFADNNLQWLAVSTGGTTDIPSIAFITEKEIKMAAESFENLYYTIFKKSFRKKKVLLTISSNITFQLISTLLKLNANVAYLPLEFAINNYALVLSIINLLGIEIWITLPILPFEIAKQIDHSEYQRMDSILLLADLTTNRIRNLIKEKFRCDIVAQVYGSAEHCLIAMSDDNGIFHPSDNSILEFLKLGKNIDYYELILTNLTNYSTPIIRYKTSDVVRRMHAFNDDLFYTFEIEGRLEECFISSDNIITPHHILSVVDRLLTSFSVISLVIEGNIDEIQVKVIVNTNSSNINFDSLHKRCTSLFKKIFGEYSNVLVDLVPTNSSKGKEVLKRFKPRYLWIKPKNINPNFPFFTT